METFSEWRAAHGAQAEPSIAPARDSRDGELTAEDLAVIDRDFGIAANTTDLRRYWVRHLRGNIVEAQFEAVAADSLACATDHAPPEGCRIDVMPLAEWRDRCAQAIDTAMHADKLRNRYDSHREEHAGASFFEQQMAEGLR